MILKYFKQIKDTLLYYDFQPLLFFWITSDMLNNQVLWTTLDYWTKVGQPYTYWLYSAYLIASISMIISINNTEWLSRFVSLYLVLYLFSTIRYVVNIFSTLDTEPFVITDFKNLLITFFYASMWTWILFKLKREVLHKSLKK